MQLKTGPFLVNYTSAPVLYTPPPWVRTGAMFWDAALMPVMCSMTYINKKADIQISLARLILP